MKLHTSPVLVSREATLHLHGPRPLVSIKAILRTTAVILFWAAALLMPVALFLMSPGDPSNSGPSF